MDGIVDFSPLVEVIISLVALVLGAIGTLVLEQVRKWLGVKKDNELVVQLDNFINHGIEYVVDEMRDAGVEKFDDVKIKNQIVEGVLEYVVSVAPKTVKELKVENKLRELIRSNLNKWLKVETPLKG